MLQLNSPESRTESLAERTYYRLADMILSGDLPDGSPVTERRLAEQLEVSRTPVREALGRLEAESLLERRGGRMLVRKVDLREFLEVLHIRKLLECDAARSAAGRMPAEQIDRLVVATQQLMHNPAPTAADHQALDGQLHAGIAAACGNRLLAETIAGLRRRTAMFDHDRLPARLEPGCQEHLQILEAIRGGDGEAAAWAMALHIDNVRASLLYHWGLH